MDGEPFPFRPDEHVLQCKYLTDAPDPWILFCGKLRTHLSFEDVEFVFLETTTEVAILHL